MNTKPTTKSETEQIPWEHLTYVGNGYFADERTMKQYRAKVFHAPDLCRKAAAIEHEFNQWREVAMELGECLQEFHHGTRTPNPECEACSALAKLSTLTTKKEHDEKC